MIDELINAAVSLVKSAWFTYPMENVKEEKGNKRNDEFLGNKEEQKDMREPKDARDVFVSNNQPDDQPSQLEENKKQHKDTLAEWLSRSLSLSTWKAETPSSFDTIQIDEYNWTKGDKDKQEVINSDKKIIDHSDIIVDEYNWKGQSAQSDDPRKSEIIKKLKQKAQALDHSDVIYDEYNWTPSSTSALKDIHSRKDSCDEGWPSVYDHGNPKK